MKICWNNLEKLRYVKKSCRWYKKNSSYVYKESCKVCGDSYLTQKGKDYESLYCSKSCVKKGKKHSEEHNSKIGKSLEGKNAPWYGKTFSKEHQKKLSIARSGNRNHRWKGGVKKAGIPLFNTYAHQIDWCEEVRRDPENKNVLQVRCSYNECKKWFRPTITIVYNRIKGLNSNGEKRFYCSDGCKNLCPVFWKRVESLIRIDAIKAGRDPWWELPREVQAELKQMVHNRDEWACIKCGSKDDLICHHLEGTLWNPLESADIDMCVTVCNECHLKIHQIPGCGNHDMRCNGGI